MKKYKINKNYLARVILLSSNTFKNGNHPCGSIIVNSKGKVISECSNKVFSTPDITAHAEILCMRKVSNLIMDKESQEVFTLYSSIEPCCGCSFFIARTKINKVVYACKDRYRPGISLLKKDPKFETYFKDIKLIEEPDMDLRDRAAKLMKDYMLIKNKPYNAKYFDPKYINETASK